MESWSDVSFRRFMSCTMKQPPGSRGKSVAQRTIGGAHLPIKGDERVTYLKDLEKQKERGRLVDRETQKDVCVGNGTFPVPGSNLRF